MQSIARILTANPEALRAGGRAGEIPSTARGSEPEPECRRCMESGWLRVDLPEGGGLRHCECLADSLYRQGHGLTVTGNYSMRDLVRHERMHPAIIRRLDDICRVVEV
jgi:hypothetical protein